MAAVVPTEIRLLKTSRCLELAYADGESYQLPCEYLRVYSPSAEVRGHAPGQEVLQQGKRYVTITDLEPAGNYALKITFSDGHDSGIYSWDYLRTLSCEMESRWQDYLERLQAAGGSRDPSGPVIIAHD